MRVRLKVFLVSAGLVFFGVGAYVGYLEALVEVDYLLSVQKTQASQDTEYLARQAEQLQRILSARKRAYQRKRDAFLSEPSRVRDEGEKSRDLVSLETKVKEIEVLERQYATIVGLQQRRLAQQSIPVSDQSAQVVPRDDGFVQRLRELIDKRQQLAMTGRSERTAREFWLEQGFSDLGGVEIVLQDRTGIKRELTEFHARQIAGIFSVMPAGFERQLRTLYIIYGDSGMRRGMAAVGVIFLRGEEEDFARVLTHESGHIVDLDQDPKVGTPSEFVDGTSIIPLEDWSSDYYSLSWKNSFERTQGKEAFVSSYGMTDPFEDFAEHFAAYVLQGRYFGSLAEGGGVMSEKYDVLGRVFDSRAFATGSTYYAMPYDITALETDYSEVLAVR